MNKAFLRRKTKKSDTIVYIVSDRKNKSSNSISLMSIVVFLLKFSVIIFNAGELFKYGEWF
ncbi:MAG: hypothetical protein BGO29_14860 [Bacteroidales bacterium 36-12]|nr:MAG: hypothetical protein BGO29_14860 [Bacteroidales bacterium 36-12]